MNCINCNSKMYQENYWKYACKCGMEKDGWWHKYYYLPIIRLRRQYFISYNNDKQYIVNLYFPYDNITSPIKIDYNITYRELKQLVKKLNKMKAFQ